MKGPWPGLGLSLVSVVLAALFSVRAYQDIYWSSPAAFVLLTLVAVCSALYGGLALGRDLRRRLRASFPHRVAFWLGGPMALAGILAGLVAVSLAAGVAMMGYWGAAPYEYSVDYLIMGHQILALRLAVPVALLGALLWALGRREAAGPLSRTGK